MKVYKYCLLASVAILSSCSVGPNYKRPQFFSDNSIAQSLNQQPDSMPVSNKWYQDLGDVFLNTLVARGLQNNPNLNATIEKLRQARLSFKINSVQNLPTFDADGSYLYSKNYASQDEYLKSDYYQVGLDASWELDIWGGGRRLTESSLALVQAAGANLDNVRLTLTAEIASNYINLRQSQQMLKNMHQNLRLQKEIFNLVKRKYEAGLVSDVDYNQAKYIVQNTAAQIPPIESQIKQYLNAITILVGQLPGNLETLLSNPDSNLVAQKFNFDLNKLYHLPASTVRKRPDVRIAEAELISQNALIGQATANLYPNISLRGFLGWQSVNLSHLITPKTDIYNYSPAISLPIFHWGSLVNNVKIQESKTKALLQLYKASLINAVAEISNSITSLQNEYKRNQASAQAETAQTKVAKLVWRQYQEGLTDFSNVLTAQQNLIDAQNQSISSNAAIYQNIISFYKSIGGGYSGK